MAGHKKWKDIKHKKDMKRDGFVENESCGQLAALFTHLGSRQDVYLFIRAANEFLSDNFHVSVSAFYNDILPPCLRPAFGIFSSSYLPSYDGPLVVTTIEALISAKNHAPRAQIYYYVFDLEWLQDENRYGDDIVRAIMNDETVVKFTRHANYRDYLTKFGVRNLNTTIVPEFNIKTILEIAYENRRN